MTKAGAKRPRHAPEPERNVSGWRSDVLDLPEWCWRHVTDNQGEKLKPMTLYRLLLGFSGLPGPTRSVLRYLADRSDYRGHSWPPLDVIARRTGYGKRTVSDAIKDAAGRGWVVVDRTLCGKGMPADYWLDIPDLAESPCADETSVNEWAEDVASAVAVADDLRSESPESQADLMQEPHEGHAGAAWGSSSSRMSLMQEPHDTSGFKHLGSDHLGSEHQRSASQSRDNQPEQEPQEQVLARLRRFVADSLHEGSSEEEQEAVREAVERHLEHHGQPTWLADELLTTRREALA